MASKLDDTKPVWRIEWDQTVIDGEETVSTSPSPYLGYRSFSTGTSRDSSLRLVRILGRGARSSSFRSVWSSQRARCYDSGRMSRIDKRKRLQPRRLKCASSRWQGLARMSFTGQENSPNKQITPDSSHVFVRAV